MLSKNHIYKKTVCGFHCDVYKHVNNARYLEFFEEARWDYLDSIKSSGILDKNNWWTMVVHIEMSYKAPLFVNDQIEIHSKVGAIGRKSITVNQQIFKSGTSNATTIANVKFVLFDTKAQKAVAINEEAKKIFGVLED